MPFSKELLREVLKQKGLGEADLAQRFGTSRAHSWLSGTRKPRADHIGFELADWLQVPLDYMYGRPSMLAGLPIGEALARASLKIFLDQEKDKIPKAAHQLYESVAKSPVAPRTAEGWRAMANDVVHASFVFAAERQKEMRRMVQSRK